MDARNVMLIEFWNPMSTMSMNVFSVRQIRTPPQSPPGTQVYLYPVIDIVEDVVSGLILDIWKAKHQIIRIKKRN